MPKSDNDENAPLTELQQAVIEHNDDMARMDRNRLASPEKDMSMTTASETVDCDLCQKPTRQIKTGRCDGCWNLLRAIQADPEAARRALDIAAPAPQPALHAGEWKSRRQYDGKILIFNSDGPLFMLGDSENAELLAAQIISDYRSAAAVPKLVAALEFVKQFFTNLENSGDETDPLTAARRRYHAPVHAAIDEALTTVQGKEQG